MKQRESVVALVLLVTLAVSPAAAAPVDPASLVPSTARRALLVPRAGPGAAEAAKVLGVAGERAPLLRPQNLSRTLAQTVALEPFDAARLAAAGVAPDGPFAVVWLPGVEAAVATVKDEAAARSALQAWLSAIGGTSAERKRGGATLQLKVAGAGALAGFALGKGKLYTARVTEPGGDAEAALLALLAVKGGRGSLAAEPLWPSVRDAAGPVKLFFRIGAEPAFLSLAAEGDAALGIVGATALPAGLPAPGKEPAPFPNVAAPDALALLRLALPPRPLAPGSSLRALTRTLTTRACPRCPAADADALADALAPTLDGRALAVATGLDVTELAAAGGRLTDGALPHLWLLGVTDTAAAKAALSRVAAKGGIPEETDAGYRTGRLVFGAADGLLWVGSNAEALRALRAAAAKDAGRSGAPLEAVLGPGAVAKALAPLDLGDAFGGGVLAGLFAVKVELQGFLQTAGPLELSATPGKAGLAIRGRWRLRK